MNRRCVLAALPALLLLTSCLTNEGQQKVPASMYGASAGAGSAGVHTVSVGETLWKISQRYKMSMRDIIKANNLNAPYMLDVGQRLELPPPREYTVRMGDTLYGVSRLFNVSVNDIARINNLDAPYTLAPGQALRLPSVGGDVPEPVQEARVARSSSAPQPGQKPGTQMVSAKQTRAGAKKPVTKAPPQRSGSRFKWPVSGKILSTYGPKKDGLHNDGINIKAPKGTPVRAAENGVVVYAGNELQGYGNLVLVRHENRWMTAYGHLDKFMIERRETVNMGQTLGTVGASGSVDTPQLHFEIRRGTEALNPKRYLE